MNKSILALIPAIALFIVGCGKQEAQTSTSPDPAEAITTPAPPAAFILDAAPEGTLATIGDLKANASPGDDVLIKVFVGGRLKPVVENLAVMTVVDAGLPNACTSDDDHCATPWDYCCAGSDELAAAMASVRVVDDKGKPLAISLIDAGLKPGDSIVVAGTVADKNDAGNLIIDAKGIHKP